MSAKNNLATQLKKFAEQRVEAAQKLAEYADNIAEMDEDHFNVFVGDEYSGLGWMTQVMDAVAEASVVRPGQQWHVNYALAEALGSAQRSQAQKGSSE